MDHYSLKKDYYDQLRQDYYEEGGKSFIFRYLEKHPRSDTCFRMILGQKWKELNAGDISCLDYMEYIVEKLSKTPKLYQEGRDYKLILPLLRYGLGLSKEESDILERTGRKKDIQEKLRLLEIQMNASDGAAKERLSKVPPVELERMTRRLEHVSLQVEVRNFFYEIGLPIIEVNKSQKEDASKRKPERKKDPSLNMLDAYCAQKKLCLSASGVRTSQESGEDYDSFFQKIAKSGNFGIIIPLMIDPRTGSALFIIGKKYIYDFQYVVSQKGNKAYEDYCCSYGILELGTYDSGDAVSGRSGEYQELLSYHAANYLFHYRDAWEEYEIVRRADLEIIQEHNRSLRGMGCPESLDIYLSGQEEQEEASEKYGDRAGDEKFLEIRDGIGPRETLGRCKRL